MGNDIKKNNGKSLVTNIILMYMSTFPCETLGFNVEKYQKHHLEINVEAWLMVVNDYKIWVIGDLRDRVTVELVIHLN